MKFKLYLIWEYSVNSSDSGDWASACTFPMKGYALYIRLLFLSLDNYVHYQYFAFY